MSKKSSRGLFRKTMRSPSASRAPHTFSLPVSSSFHTHSKLGVMASSQFDFELQSLSEFEDARESRGKAETAAAALRRIYPSIDSQAIRLTVPMPGHTVSSSEETSLERDVALVDDLVAKHDVVFLALDSREARWLPTMLATKHGKMAFSVALGFDNYVVIRHGVKNDAADHQSASGIISVKEGTLIPYSDLACYFCSDVTAPGNSTTDRTLDQQCTVSWH
ncbi:hypothetical protein Y032_0513g2757 [Ancylostoma ceylanicum]|nr:hypothetical protein Y032_0513g2757 [Ancylostoma ceylanicum]